MPMPGLSQSLAAIWACLLLAEADAPASAIPLAFSPVKLIFLLGWVYLCLYLVQRVDDSPLVPSRYKSILYVVTLFAGPLVFLGLVLADTKKSAQQGSPFADIVQRLRDAVLRIWHSGAPELEDDSTLRLFDSTGTELSEIYGHGESRAADRHVLDLTVQIIDDALQQRASDILIDPKDQLSYAVRLRIDGTLRTVRDLPAETCRAVINSVKAVSSMDISERRRPQDGAFTARKGETTFSFRVASAGALNGEKLSIRVLNQNAGQFTLADAGIPERQRAVIAERHQQTVRHGADLRADRQRQDHHLVLDVESDRPLHAQRDYGRRSDRSLSAGSQPDRDQRQGRHHVRQGAAEHPPAGPRRDLRGRNPRRGNGRDRAARGTDRPPGAGHHPLRQQRHGPDPAVGLGRLAHAAVVGTEPAGFAAADAQTLRSVQEAGPTQRQHGPGIPPKRHRHEEHVRSPGAASGAAEPATTDGWRSATCWSSPTNCGPRLPTTRRSPPSSRTKAEKKGRSTLNSEAMRAVVAGITSLEELKRVVG